MLMLNFQDLFPFGIKQLLEVLQLLVFVPLLPHYILPYFTLPKSLTCSTVAYIKFCDFRRREPIHSAGRSRKI